MIIRKARLEDANGIAEVHVDAWKQAYKGIIHKDYLNGLITEDRRRLWQNSLSTPHDRESVYVAVNKEDKIVGFASFGMDRESDNETEGELFAIYLLEEYKGQKIGKRLFKAGVQKLIEHKFQSVSVWVLADNPSRKFYEKFSPLLFRTKTIQIGNESFEEIAYKWEDIKNLYTLLDQVNA